MYLLFAGDQYYPLGGWRDYHGEYPTLEAALREAATTQADWWHVVHNGDVIESGRRG